VAGKTSSQIYLYIDGVSSRDLFIALINKSGQIISQRLIKNGSRTEKLLTSLVEFIGKPPQKLKGIIVVQGGGSFSQSRLVCTVANTLAYAWGIKVAATSSWPNTEEERELAHLRWQKILQPVYRGPGVG